MHDSEALALFIQETGNLIDDLESGLLELESTLDQGSVHTLFRAAHTIKGNSAILGATVCAHFTHLLEGVLARIRDGNLAAEGFVVNTLLQAVDVLRTLAAGIAAGDPNPALEGRDELVAALEDLGGAEVAGSFQAPDELRTLRIAVAVAPGGSPSALAALVEEIAGCGELLAIEPARGTEGAAEFHLDLRTTSRTADVEAMALFSDATIAIEAVGAARPEPAGSASSPRARLAAPEPGPAPGPLAAAAARAGARATKAVVRVDPERLDGLLDLLGELMLALGGTRRLCADSAATPRARIESIEVLDRIASEMHGRVMSLRMVPVKDTFDRLRRPVRDAAQQLGKDVTLEVSGEDTELDRKLLEELADPLMHMVRNAVAHGIEAPEQRALAGKPRAGVMQLRAMHREGAAIIEVEDDGAGIDTARVLRRAVERGLVPSGAQLTEQETYALLFAPGFSTAEAVNQVAGRGVGLDVVVSSVERLRGRVEILSKLGSGTIFRIRLPLTLAVLDAMKVRVGRETVGIPIRDVEAVVDARQTPVRTLEGVAEYVDVRGELLPLVRLGELLGLAGESGLDASHANVVVVRSDRRRFALSVGAVLGVGRSVMKSLDISFDVCRAAAPGFKRPGGVGGATILDDGTVGYLLDVSGVDATAFGASV